MVIPNVATASSSDMRSNSFKQTESTGGDNISSIIRNFERNSNVRLSSEIIDLIRENNIKPSAERGGIGEVSVVKFHSCLVSIVRVDVDVIDSLSVEVGRSPDQSMDFVALLEKELSKVGTILTSNASN